MQARIAQRAHELFQQRGGHHGQDLNDWFRAASWERGFQLGSGNLRAEQEVLENKCEPVS